MEAEKEVAILNKSQPPANPIAHIPKLLALSGKVDMTEQERAVFDRMLVRMYEEEQQREAEAASAALAAAPVVPPLPDFSGGPASLLPSSQPPLQPQQVAASV